MLNRYKSPKESSYSAPSCALPRLKLDILCHTRLQMPSTLAAPIDSNRIEAYFSRLYNYQPMDNGGHEWPHISHMICNASCEEATRDGRWCSIYTQQRVLYLRHLHLLLSRDPQQLHLLRGSPFSCHSFPHLPQP